MPSVSQTVLILLGVSTLLVGCSTTQQTSARLKVRADRILASRAPVEVRAEDPAIRVTDTGLLRDHASAAIAVSLHNSSPDPLNDLPVLVGVRTPGGTVLVNHGGGFRYFETHNPGLAPKGDTTWVFTAPAKKVPAGEPVVRVGRADEPPTVSESLPVVPISGISSKSDKKATTVRATVANDGDFPQYDLVLYAAAQKSIGDLGTGKERTVRIPLIGDPGKAKVHVFASPTIFE